MAEHQPFLVPISLKRLLIRWHFNGLLNWPKIMSLVLKATQIIQQKLIYKPLYDVGFRRVSYGVQDYNETVQKAIHRIQPFENVKRATELAREIGYTSVGHDIIFGLPFQTLEHVKETILKTKALLPDRLAFYSYAHVPWIKGNGQRGFKATDLPSADLKRSSVRVR